MKKLLIMALLIMSPLIKATEVELVKSSFFHEGKFHKVIIVLNKDTGEYIKYFDCLKDKTTSPYIIDVCDFDAVPL
jgi:hypothetical protein